MQSMCIKYPSAIWMSCGSSLLRHGLNFSRALWTMRLNSGEKDWNLCVHAKGGHFEHLLWRCLLNIQVYTHHNRLFAEPPASGLKQYTFSQMSTLCISQGSVVTFFRYGGQVHSHSYSLFYSEVTQIIRSMY